MIFERLIFPKPVAVSLPTLKFIGLLRGYRNISRKGSYLSKVAFSELTPLALVFELQRVNECTGLFKGSIDSEGISDCACPKPVTVSLPSTL
jgi:hypothetical protein